MRSAAGRRLTQWLVGRRVAGPYFLPGGVVKGELLLTATEGLGFSALGLRTSLLLLT